MMPVIKRLLKKDGMTLIEILVAIALLGVVCVLLMPVFSFSLRSLNFANSNTQAVLEATGKIEVVAATKAGVLFSDGTFIPMSQFPLSGSNYVVGATVLQSDIIKFLAGIPHIKLEQLPIAEGYEPDTVPSGSTVRVNVIGSNTHFIGSPNTTLRIEDKDGNPASYVNFGITGPERAWVDLSLGMLNEDSPYTITFKTGGEIVSSLLMLGQPPYIVVGNNKILVSQIPKEYYESRNNPVSATGNAVVLNGAIYARNRNIPAAYYSVGYDAAGNGVVQRKRGEEAWQKLTIAACAGKPVNDIAHGSDILIAVGNGGLILTSEDGNTWTPQTSGVTENLRSVLPVSTPDTAIKFVAAGEGETILTSTDGVSWTSRQAAALSPPIYQPGALTGNGSKPAFRFDGTQLLKTVTAPVAGSNPRSVFMVVKPTLDVSPTVNHDTLLEWGRGGGPIAPATNGPRWTLRIDGASSNRLRAEQGGTGTNSSYTSTFAVPGSPVILGQTWNGTNMTLMSATTTPSVTVNNGTVLNVYTTEQPAFIGGAISGWRNNKDYMYKGDIAEILVYNAALDPATSRTVTDYLANKYIGAITGASGNPPSEYLKLWLDAETPGSGTVGGKQIVWADRSGKYNHAIGGWNLNAIAYGRFPSNSDGQKDVFVIAADGGQLFQSYDCISWVRRNVVTTGDDLNDIIFDGTRFIAVGDTGRLVHSTNGTTSWVSAVAVTGNTKNINDISYSSVDNVWLMVGNNGLLFTSDNGTSWTDRSTLIPAVARTDNFNCITNR